MQCPKCEGYGWVPTGKYAGECIDCPECRGSGEQPDAIEGVLLESGPGLADVVALLERQAKTCERIAKTLGEIAETVKGL